MEQPNTDRTLDIMVEMGREAKLIRDGARVSSQIAIAYGNRNGAINDEHYAAQRSACEAAQSRLDALSMLSVRLGLCAHQQAFLDLL